QQPQSQTNIAGDNVTFTVTVTNNATLPITYQWRKGSSPLTNTVLNARTCSLTLFNVATSVTTTNGPGDYRVVVMNAANPSPGLASSFANLKVIPATTPTATTLAASDIGPTYATLNATINPMGAQTLAWLDYGLTASYGSRTVTTNVGNNSNSVPLALRVGGLLPNTNYHYRVVATNHGGIARGQDISFLTAPLPRPTISSLARLSNGPFHLQFSGVNGASYRVLVSTNLLDWAALGSATETAPGQFEFTDAEAENHSTRFYQLRSP